jgi:GNAT superfamily N-acetyltransferase
VNPNPGRVLPGELSLQSRQRRFLSALSDLDDAMMQRLVGEVDGVHHIALVLVVLPPDGEEWPVGVARLVQDPADPASAEIAFTVADEWQGRGVGTALVEALIRRRPAAVTRPNRSARPSCAACSSCAGPRSMLRSKPRRPG